MSQTPARKTRRFARSVVRRLARRFARAVVRRGERGQAQLSVLRFLVSLGASIKAAQAMEQAQ